MAGNRKAAMAVLEKELGMLDKTGNSVRFYKENLGKLDDAQFDDFVELCARREEFISLIIPNFQGDGLTFEHLLAVGDKLGHEFFEQVWLTDRVTGITYLTPEKYMIIVIPLRRQSQSLMTKMSVATDNSHIDTLSGQPTGDSKTSRLSFIEMQFLNNQGIDAAVEELMKVRGGNMLAMANFDQQVIETGSGSLNAPGMDEGRVKSVEVLAAYMTAMHLANTFLQDGH